MKAQKGMTNHSINGQGCQLALLLCPRCSLWWVVVGPPSWLPTPASASPRTWPVRPMPGSAPRRWVCAETASASAVQLYPDTWSSCRPRRPTRDSSAEPPKARWDGALASCRAAPILTPMRLPCAEASPTLSSVAHRTTAKSSIKTTVFNNQLPSYSFTMKCMFYCFYDQRSLV